MLVFLSLGFFVQLGYSDTGYAILLLYFSHLVVFFTAK